MSGQIEYLMPGAEQVNLQELQEFYDQHCGSSVGPDRLQAMLRRSSAVVLARQSGRLVGLARGLSDGQQGFLTECKLDPALQGPAAVTRTDGRIEHDQHGIAREMAMRVLEALVEEGVERINVRAHGTEEDFCAELGFRRVSGAVAMSLETPDLAPCRMSAGVAAS